MKPPAHRIHAAWKRRAVELAACGGAVLLAAAAPAPANPLSYNFDDRTFQGWADLTVPNSGNGPRHWTAAGTAPEGLFLRGGTQSGNGAVEQVIAGHEDNPHPTLLLARRSSSWTAAAL